MPKLSYRTMEIKPQGQAPKTCILIASWEVLIVEGSTGPCLQQALPGCLLVSSQRLALAMHQGPTTCECFEDLLEPFPFLAHTPLNKFQKVHCCCLRKHREFFITFHRFSLLLRTVSWTSVAFQRSTASKLAFTEGRHRSWSPVLSLNRAFNIAQKGRERNFSIFQTLTSEGFLQTDFHK